MSRSNSAALNSPSQFGPWRSMLWPIHNFELKKFLPMFAMFFFVSFNYSLLRVFKDALVVNGAGTGAEVLPVLKIFGTMPAAILVMGFYIKLATMVSRQKLFYITLAPFLLGFILFPTVIYPNVEFLHPTTSADWLEGIFASVSPGAAKFVGVYRYWTFSLVYILAELWGSVILSTLYWGLANEITKVSEAKRFYGLLGVGANLALLFVWPAARLGNSLGDWTATLNFVMLLASLSCIGIAWFYWYINNRVMVDPRFVVTPDVAPKKKSKVKLGFVDSLRELAKSRYLLCLAVMVLCYGVSINLVEVTWKSSVNAHFGGDRQNYMDFSAGFVSATGLLTIPLMMFGTSNVLRIYGWRVAALLTPIVLLATSIVFFFGLTFQDVLSGIFATVGVAGMTPLLLVIWAGGIQNMASKATKYSFFDPTKEMAYIPLDDHTRRTGKAAIDGVGARIGKSGGSAINVALITILGTMEVITPYIAVATIGIIVIWIVAVYALSTRFEALTGESHGGTSSPIRSAAKSAAGTAMVTGAPANGEGAKA